MLLSLRRSVMGVADFRPGDEDDAVLATVDWTMAVLAPPANKTLNPHPLIRYVVCSSEVFATEDRISLQMLLVCIGSSGCTHAKGEQGVAGP